MAEISANLLKQRIMDFIVSNLQRIVVIFAVLASIFLPLALQAYDIQTCKYCHMETLDKDNSKMYPHPPFKEDECEECHASSETNVNSANQIDWGKIKWLIESSVNDTNHAFILSDDKLRDTLVVQLFGKTGELSRHVIALPSRTELSEVKDGGNSPTISNIQVLEVKQGMFISATIGWETDTLADASVRYTNGDFSQTSTPSKRLARKHQVFLSRLKPGRSYQFSAISKDLFSRSQVSEPLTFSTSDFFSVTQPPDNNGDMSEKEGGLTHSFQRFGTDYLIELTLKQPASIRIGTTGEKRCLPDDGAHAGLSCSKLFSIETCLNCHSSHDHPVNVSPTKRGIIIPPEFPSLEGGRIICISCHESHGSNHMSLTRRNRERGLCVSCHVKWN